jgi:hypothetical protein
MFSAITRMALPRNNAIALTGRQSLRVRRENPHQDFTINERGGIAGYRLNLLARPLRLCYLLMKRVDDQRIVTGGEQNCGDNERVAAAAKFLQATWPCAS